MDSILSKTPFAVTAHLSTLRKGYGVTNQHLLCETTECQMNMELAWRSVLVVYECIHLASVMYCASCASSPLLLEETLAVMVNRKWFSEDITPLTSLHWLLLKQYHTSSSLVWLDGKLSYQWLTQRHLTVITTPVQWRGIVCNNFQCCCTLYQN